MEAVIGGGFGAALTAVVSWLLSRRRERSDIAHIDADTEHTQVETLGQSMTMYSQLFAQHKKLAVEHQQIVLRLLRIEKWAVENGYELPNGDHSG